MNLKEIQDDVYKNSVEHGWHDKERSFGDVIALIHSELSEALEEYRNGKPDVYEENGKPEGILVELADAVIRIMDFFGEVNADLEEVIIYKHNYNRTRSYRHGNKKI